MRPAALPPNGHNAAMETTRALMQGVIDYAGLFPPAGLDMQRTVANYAKHRAGEDGWALGRLVVPVKRLGEFERSAEGLLPTGDRDDREDPWQLTVLSEATGDESFEDELNHVERFNQRHGMPGAGRAIIETIEIKARSVNAIEGALELMPETLFPWFELPWQQDVRGMVAALSEMESGAKVRTGGTTADAHPSPLQLAKFLAACHGADVPFKATAGLHHPFRHHAASVGCEQFGFVNVFLGGALLHHGVIEQEELEMLLSDNHGKHFEFSPMSVAWKGRSVSLIQLREAREKFCASFGSCSFDEPLGDLRSIHLLPPHAAKS
jgi:hypothetical protein